MSIGLREGVIQCKNCRRILIFNGTDLIKKEQKIYYDTVKKYYLKCFCGHMIYIDNPDPLFK